MGGVHARRNDGGGVSEPFGLCAEVTGALRRVALLSAERSRAVKLELSEGQTTG
jgi:hypothetical protein